MSTPRWIELDGAANVRDVGGLPTESGSTTQPGRLIRSDNLQGLTDADVRSLVDEHGVRSVADLRSDVEVVGEGPGPMTREPSVTVTTLSLFPESGHNTDAASDADNDGDDDGAGDAPVALPWQGEKRAADVRRRGMVGVYLRYLNDRPDSVIAALRMIATSDGATIVHCAAGKDRTGVVVAFALAEVGVQRAAIIADYAASAERISAIFARLVSSPTYRDDVSGQSIDKHSPRAETLVGLFEAMDERFGGVPGWLRAHGWTEADAAALRAKLLD